MRRQDTFWRVLLVGLLGRLPLVVAGCVCLGVLGPAMAQDTAPGAVLSQVRPELRPLAPVSAPRPVQAIVAPVADDPVRRPAPRRRLPVSCTSDGLHCIGQNGYVADVCRTIEALAGETGLDPFFFARLLWKESLFDPYAVSRVGALGIAQFMPDTARLRALDDPFNPAESLRASAYYLADLRARYGNLGLAAAAYNGGEGRISRYLEGTGGLPLETRAYVFAITGYSVDTWRREGPASPDFSTDMGHPFFGSCSAMAQTRTMREYRVPDELMPWVVVLAVHPDKQIVRTRAETLRRSYPDLFRDAHIRLGRSRLPGRAQSMATALIGAPNGAEAASLCNRIRAAGGGCMALRNSGFYEPTDCPTCSAVASEASIRIGQLEPEDQTSGTGPKTTPPFVVAP